MNQFWEQLPEIVTVNEKGLITIKPKYTADIRSMGLYKENHKKNRIVEEAYALSYDNAISLKTINKKFKTIKSAPESVFIFFDPISGNETFKIKDNLDYQNILDAKYPGLQQYYFPAKERKKIVAFCKKNSETTEGTIKIRAKLNKEEKRHSHTTAYCGYAYFPNPVGALSIDDFILNYSESLQCQIESRREQGSKIIPFKGQPKDIIKLELYGLDTLTVSYHFRKAIRPYAVSNGTMIYYAEPIKTFDVLKVKNNQEPETMNTSKKESWFSRTWHNIFHKANKDEASDSGTSKSVNNKEKRAESKRIKKEKETVTERNESWFSGIWHKVFPQKSKDEDVAIQEKPHKKDVEQKTKGKIIPKRDKENETEKPKDGQALIAKLWDKIIFWK